MNRRAPLSRGFSLPETLSASDDEEATLESTPDVQTLVLSTTEYAAGSEHALQAAAKMPSGASYVSGVARARIPTQRGGEAQTLRAEIAWQKADSLTAFFADPKWERCPLWEIDGARSGDKSDGPKDGPMWGTLDVETSATVTTTGVAVKTEDLRGNVRGFFAGAPRRGLFTSIGELGFCHSGFVNFPIVLTGAIGWNEYQLNSPRNGPPMRMLLDLFTPGAFTDAQTRQPVSETAWRNGNYNSNSPTRPRRGTWNMNTTIAHDAYLAIREGDPGAVEMKKEVDPTNMSVRVAWAPAAAGYRRTEDGAEHYRGKNLGDLAKKPVIGLPLDRYSNPMPVLNRATGAWASLLGGDFSLGRMTGGTRWAFNNSGAAHLGPAQFTWQPGTGAVPYGSAAPFADFAGKAGASAKLLTFASDGRKEGGDDKGDGNVKHGHLRGRFAADQNLTPLQPNSPVSLPAAMATRFSLVPMRHFVSDLAEEFNYGAAFADFKTALNPRRSAFPPSTNLKDSDGDAFPGGHHASGIFANAPVALLANQVSTSANVFTIHVVAQAVKDSGQVRAESRRSGPGHSDADDEVLAERWFRVVFAKLPSANESRFQVLSADTRNAAE